VSESSPSPWFSSAFGAFYTEVYAHRNEEEAQQHFPQIKKLAKLDKSHLSILDLGCGQGRYSQLLHQEQHQVIGLDYSSDLLQIAKQDYPSLSLCRGNMLELPFKHEFDRILSLFTSFGYFSDDTENVKVLREMTRLLKRDGFIYLDFLNSKLVTESPWEEKVLGKYLQKSMKQILSSENAVQKHIQLFENNTCVHEYYEYVKLYDLAWFQAQAHQLNLSISSVYGDYEGQEFNPSESPRLILLIEKQA